MIERVVTARPRPVGNITVVRALPVLGRRTVGPFVFFDHMGPARLPPGHGFDVPPHPHIGLSTVTYLFEGEIVHRDSTGVTQAIRPGDINLMTAGRGVVHSERSAPSVRAAGAFLHGAQLWLGALAEREEDEPSFAHYEGLPAVDGIGWRARVLMGSAFGATSPIVHPSRPLFVDVQLDAGATFVVPPASDVAVYTVSGGIHVEGSDYTLGQLICGSELVASAREPSRLLVIGGEPLGGRRYLDWNFVSSRPERIETAVADWRANRFPLLASDPDERVPYPERIHGQHH